MLGAVAQCLVWKVALKEEEVEEEREEVKDGWRRQARSLMMCFSRLIILEKVLNYIFYEAKQFVELMAVIGQPISEAVKQVRVQLTPIA